MTRPLLLDTHVLLWWLTQPRKLSPRVHRMIERSAVFVSVITVWEIRLKQESRGMTVPAGDLAGLVAAEDFELMALTVGHVEVAAGFGVMHGDPYDRLLLGTARAERMTLVTRDAKLLEYAASFGNELVLEA